VSTVRTYDVDGIKVRGDEVVAQPSRGTVILLHGGGQTRHSWKGAAKVLADAGWSSVALDTRGHGESDWAPDHNYGMAALVDDLAAVADTLDTPPVLVGASMGGLTSLMAVGEGKVRARGLVLVDVAPRIEPEGSRRVRDFMRARPEGFASLEEVADAVSAYNPHRTRPRSLEGLKKNVRLRDGRWHWHWDPAFMRPLDDEPTRMIDYDRLAAAARAVTVPTLLVRGVQSDVLSPAGAQELLSLVPGSRLADVEGTGHMVAGDDNDAFARAVVDFLDGLD
jgi:pimeloyl-ACP methyl ester carboxylesterase